MSFRKIGIVDRDIGYAIFCFSYMDKYKQYDEIIAKVHELFEVDKISFDINWREKFIHTIV